jgi:hypothetical protein
MSPTKAFALAVVLNVIAVLAMEHVRQLWKGAPPAFAFEPALWYTALAVTIVATQFCLIAASLAEGFPMYVAIGINIAFVLTAATLNGCRSSGRWPTLAEFAWLTALIATACMFQYVSANAERTHQQQTQVANQENDA